MSSGEKSDKRALVAAWPSQKLAKNEIANRGLELAFRLSNHRRKVLLLRDLSLQSWFDVIAQALRQQEQYEVNDVQVDTAEEALRVFATCNADLAIATSNLFLPFGYDPSYITEFFALNKRTHLLLWSPSRIFLSEAVIACGTLPESTNRLECVSLDLGLKQVLFAVENTIGGGPPLFLA